MPGIASAATSVVIGYLAGGTSTIRVGAGGIMLPNHSPLVIAEQFGTLESLYPGPDRPRARAARPAPTSAPLRALRRDPMARRRLPAGVQELQAFLAPAQPGQTIQAVPGAGTQVPIWILGSSTVRRAARGGARAAVRVRLALRARRPARGAGASTASGSSRRRSSSGRTRWRRQRRRGRHRRGGAAAVHVAAAGVRATSGAAGPGQLPPPVDDIERSLAPAEKLQASHMLRYAVVGSPETVRAGAGGFVDQTEADELMVRPTDLRPGGAAALLRDRGRGRSGAGD